MGGEGGVGVVTGEKGGGRGKTKLGGRGGQLPGGRGKGRQTTVKSGMVKWLISRKYCGVQKSEQDADHYQKHMYIYIYIY